LCFRTETIGSSRKRNWEILFTGNVTWKLIKHLSWLDTCFLQIRKWFPLEVKKMAFYLLCIRNTYLFLQCCKNWMICCHIGVMCASFSFDRASLLAKWCLLIYIIWNDEENFLSKCWSLYELGTAIIRWYYVL